MPLTEKELSNAAPRSKPYKLTDGGGLYLEVLPTGGRYWRMKYRRPDGKENRLAFGVYPTVRGKEAREKREEARRLLAQGTDPAAERKARKGGSRPGGGSFEAVSRE